MVDSVRRNEMGTNMDIRAFVKKYFANDPDIVLALGQAFGSRSSVRILMDDQDAQMRLTEAGCDEAQIIRIEEALQEEGFYKEFTADEAKEIIGADVQAENIASKALELPGNPHRNLRSLLRAAGCENDRVLLMRVRQTEQWRAKVKDFTAQNPNDQSDTLDSLELTPRAWRALEHIGVKNHISEAIGNRLFNERALRYHRGCGDVTVHEIRTKFYARGIDLPKNGPLHAE